MATPPTGQSSPFLLKGEPVTDRGKNRQRVLRAYMRASLKSEQGNRAHEKRAKSLIFEEIDKGSHGINPVCLYPLPYSPTLYGATANWAVGSGELGHSAGNRATTPILIGLRKSSNRRTRGQTLPSPVQAS